MKFSGKVVLITGGAQGIGKETAKQFLQEGARVVICDYDESAGSNALEELKSEHVTFLKVDVTDSSQIEEMVQTTIGMHGRIDVLINNAGIIFGWVSHENEGNRLGKGYCC